MNSLIHNRNVAFDMTRQVLEFNAQLREKIETLFDKIKHGDEKHQAWLKETINLHFWGDE